MDKNFAKESRWQKFSPGKNFRLYGIMHCTSMYTYKHTCNMNAILCPFCFSPLYSIIIFVSFWAESALHNAITGEASQIVSFTNSSAIVDTAGNTAVDVVETVVLYIEGKRYNIHVHAHSILAMPFKRGAVPPYFCQCAHLLSKTTPIVAHFLVDFQ